MTLDFDLDSVALPSLRAKMKRMHRLSGALRLMAINKPRCAIWYPQPGTSRARCLNPPRYEPSEKHASQEYVQLPLTMTGGADAGSTPGRKS